MPVPHGGCSHRRHADRPSASERQDRKDQHREYRYDGSAWASIHVSARVAQADEPAGTAYQQDRPDQWMADAIGQKHQADEGGMARLGWLSTTPPPRSLWRLGLNATAFDGKDARVHK